MVNTKISTVLSRQIPEFIRSNHPNFVNFIEAYYEYLEQANNTLSSGKTIDRAKNLLVNSDIDSSIDGFSEQLYEEFLTYFPKDAVANKKLILKNVKDFYRARGTEKSFKFLFRAIYGVEADIYLPKEDILRASSAKWLVEKSLRVRDVYLNGSNANLSITAANTFVATQIVGNTSSATAIVERITTSYINEAPVFELYLSNKQGTFADGEHIFTVDVMGNTVSAQVYSGIVTSVTVTDPGSRYREGDLLIFEPTSTGGSGAYAFVSQVSSGNVSGVTVDYGGAGYMSGDPLVFTSSKGSGAAGNILVVDSDGDSNGGPGVYNVCVTTWEEWNSGNTSSANGNTWGSFDWGISGHTANGNISFTNAFAFSTLTVGPALTANVTAVGSGYRRAPNVSATGNTLLTQIGALGRLQINQRGSGYAVGDRLIFTNVRGGYGMGANGEVVAVTGAGGIQQVRLTASIDDSGNSMQFIGGSGYDQYHLPSVSITSAGGSGANITVNCILGYGATFDADVGTFGAIEDVILISGGANYRTTPLINLTQEGDGTAQAYCNIVNGSFTYPGRYVDDTSTLSSFSTLQDQDYFQNYSYDIRVAKSIATYKQYVKNLVHPLGTTMHGSFLHGGTNNIIVLANTSVSSNHVNLLANANNLPSATLFYPGGGMYRNLDAFRNGTILDPLGNSKLAIVNFWINFQNGVLENTSQTIIHFGNLWVNFHNTSTSNTSSHRFQMLGKNANGDVTMNVFSNNVVVSPNTWINFLATYNLNGPNANIYLNNVCSTNVITLTADANVHCNVNTTVTVANNWPYAVAMHDIMIVANSAHWVDITANVTERQKFITIYNMPVFHGTFNNIESVWNALFMRLNPANTNFLRWGGSTTSLEFANVSANTTSNTTGWDI